MSSSKKIYLKRDFAAGVFLSETPSPPTRPPPLHTLYVYTVIGGKGELTREKVRGGKVENTNMTDRISKGL